MISRSECCHRLARLVAVCVVGIGFTNIANAEVVFGNLEASGTGALDSQNVDLGPSASTTFAIATGFTTGASSEFLTVQSIVLGAFADPVGLRSVSIYTNNAGVPGTPFSVSSSTAVGATGLYAFSFSNVALTANTTYWVVPQFNADWSSYFDADLEAPTALNGSDWSYVGVKRQVQSNPGVWSNGSTGYSLSINAVPEPSTYCMAAIGAGVAGLMGWRRRKGAADAAVAV